MAVSVVELVDHVAEASSLLGSYTISAFVKHNIAEVVIFKVSLSLHVHG